MADDKTDDKIIQVAGKNINMFLWAMAARLDATLDQPSTEPGTGLTRKHQFAFALQCGFEEGQRKLDDSLRVQSALRTAEIELDRISGTLQTLRRSIT